MTQQNTVTTIDVKSCTVECIEFTSKKGAKMCKLLVRKTYDENGEEKTFDVESASYKSDDLLEIQFKFKNKWQSDLFKPLTALESLKNVVGNYKKDISYLTTFMSVNVETVDLFIINRDPIEY